MPPEPEALILFGGGQCRVAIVALKGPQVKVDAGTVLFGVGGALT